MVVIQSFAVYGVPERVSAVNPDGMEVIVPVTPVILPLELGLPVVIELGLVETSPVDPTAVEPAPLELGPTGLVPDRELGDVGVPLGMMPLTLVEVQFVGPPLGPHTVNVLVAVVFG